MHAQDFEHRLAVLVVAGERAHPGRGPGGDGVGVARHQSRYGARPCAPGVGIVRDPLGHKQRAQIGVTQSQLAETPGRVPDRLGRVVGIADQDLLPGEGDLDRRFEPLHVEVVVGVQECQ